MQKNHDELQSYINDLTIIDTHEHFLVEAARPQHGDILTEWLQQYFSCDLRSAGLSRKDLAEVVNGTSGLRNRWKIVEPYWHRVRSTAYGRALELAARDIYGFERVDTNTIEPLDAAFQAARAAGGHYDRVLGEKCRIALCVRDGIFPGEPPGDSRIVYAPRIDPFLFPAHRSQIREMGEIEALKIHCLSTVPSKSPSGSSTTTRSTPCNSTGF